MFDNDPILVVEDNVYLALDLSNAIEDWNGRVIGPVDTVTDALALLRKEEILGAVLDFHLNDRDASPIAAHLADQGIPFVIHTTNDLPSDVVALHPSVPVLKKPLHPSFILECLLGEIRKSNAPKGHRHTPD